MSDNKDFDDIDRILKEFEAQKAKRIEEDKSFSLDEELAPPKRSRRQREIVGEESNEASEKNDKKKKASFSKLAFLRCAVIFAVIAVSIAVGAFLGYMCEHKDIEKNNANISNYAQKYPGVEFPSGIMESQCEAYGKNQNYLGRITFPDSESAEFYSSIEQGSYAKIDTRSSVSPLSRNLVIYAGEDFFNLEAKYSTAELYQQNSPTFTLNTLFESRTCKINGVYYTNTNPEQDRDYVFPFNASQMTDDSFIQFRGKLESRFIYSTDRRIKAYDTIVSLVCDSTVFEGAKFIVVASVIPNDESKKVNQKNVKVNEDPHYPQIWYDVQNVKNTYRLSGKWYPAVETGKEKETSKQSAKDFQ